jgi:hypothetical protein
MVKVTLEVPESLLGDIYIAVGAVLERYEADQRAEQARAPEPSDSDQVGAEA